jgi:type I restriction enzyme, S subunit
LNTSVNRQLSPRLRFEEFGGDWAHRKLDALLSAVVDNRGKTPPTSSEGIPLIEANAVGEREINYAVCSKYVSKEVFENWFRKYLDDGDTVFVTVGSTAQCSLYRTTVTAAIAQNLVGLRFADQDARFMFYALTTSLNKKAFKRIQMGAVQPSIKVSQMIHVKIPVPPLPEQQKIADFLTAVDGRIGQLIQKKALLEDYKKGVMQQLFTQAIRFKDDHGNDFPDWEKKKLGEIGKITTGKTPSTSDDAAWVGHTMFVTPSDIGKDTKFQHKTSRHVNGEKLRLIPKNSLMFTCIASVGKMSIATQPCITNQQINSVSVGSGFLFEYVYYALRKLTPKIKSTQANNTLPIINKTEFSKFILPIPSLPEQTKIADFLSAIDSKIESVTTQITETQTFKKGLLQQMFV